MNILKPLVFLISSLLLGIGNLTAQKSSSVMITTITFGKQITVQVVDNENKTTSEDDRVSPEKPEQAYLKMEMDKWIDKGYKINQSYAYSASSGSSPYISNIRYETVILTKEEL